MQLSTYITAGPPERGGEDELRDYLQLLVRELDVLLRNLDEENFNPRALERIEAAREREEEHDAAETAVP